MAWYPIVDKAFEHLPEGFSLNYKWEEAPARSRKDVYFRDGSLLLSGERWKIKLAAEVKKEVRAAHVQGILAAINNYKTPIVIAERIYTNAKEQLREAGIAYLESNGNMYINYDKVFLFIDHNAPAAKVTEASNRAFTKTGLRVLFHFLLDEQLLNEPYRHIADVAGTSPGNVTHIIKGLGKEGYLVQTAKRTYKLAKRKELFDKWVSFYGERLQPALLKGRFRFVKQEDDLKWKELELGNDSVWGGEAAGELLTGYLSAGTLALYTSEDVKDIIKEYRMVPDSRGNIEIREKFWSNGSGREKTAPPLLVYADLVNTGDRRCMETAQKIYNEYLKDKF